MLGRRRARRIFLDCGGYDGCSVIEFLTARPGYRVVSFEPNPQLWGYYRWLPTTLVKQAVTTFDGRVALTLDPVDADGSSILADKAVVFDRSVPNSECPTIHAECLDLSAHLARTIGPEDHVALKLDVEGAEYDILERMLADGTIDLVDELLVEFHWHKCGVSEDRHDALVEALRARTHVTEWDAAGSAVHQRGRKVLVARLLRLPWLWVRHLRAWVSWGLRSRVRRTEPDRDGPAHRPRPRVQ